MRRPLSKRTCESDRRCTQTHRSRAANAPVVIIGQLIVFQAVSANRLKAFGFRFLLRLARNMQETDRSVSSTQGEKWMTAVAQKTVLTGCLAPIDRGGLE